MQKWWKNSILSFLVFLLVFSSFGTAFATGTNENAETPSEEAQNENTDDVIDQLTEEEMEALRWDVLRQHIILYEELEQEEDWDLEALEAYLLAFQEEHNLELTPTYSNESWETMSELLQEKGYYFFFGMYTEQVPALKEALRSFFNGELFTEENISPFFGQITQEAVKALQEEEELDAHGAVDEDTAAALALDLEELFPEEESSVVETPVTEEARDEENSSEETAANEENESAEEEAAEDESSENESTEENEEGTSSEENAAAEESNEGNRNEENEEDAIEEEEAAEEQSSENESTEENEEGTSSEENAAAEETDEGNRSEENEEDAIDEEEAAEEQSSENESTEENEELTSSEENEGNGNEETEGNEEADEETTEEQNSERSDREENEEAENEASSGNEEENVSREESEELEREEETDSSESLEEEQDTFSTMMVEETELVLPYQDGDEGEDIVQLKHDLTKLGFGTFPSSPSNRFGPVTMGVVSDFQEYFGLPAHGEVDEETMQRLQEEVNTFYQDFSEGEGIPSFKQALTALDFGSFPENPSDRFGPVTAGVVKEFQRDNELVVNGMGDSVTRAALDTQAEDIFENASLSVPFEDGDSGEAVRQLKLDLTELGFGTFPVSPSDRYGPVTMGVVRDFQEYFGLTITGITDQQTLDRLEQELSTLFRDGQADSAITAFKEDLTKLGYGTFPRNPSNRYGPVTMGVVSDFQEAEGLVVNGLGDSVTVDRLQTRVNEHLSEALVLPFEDGDAGDRIIQLKKDLTTLGFGTFPASPSNRYGPVTMGVVEDFQSYYGMSVTGITNQAVLDRIKTELGTIFRDGQAHRDIVKLKTDLTKLGFGTFPSSPSNRYGPVTSGVVKEFQQENGLKVNGIGDSVTMQTIAAQIEDVVIGTGTITASNLNIRSGPSTSYDVIKRLPRGTEVDILEEVNGWYRISHPDISGSRAYGFASYIRTEGEALSYPYRTGDSGEEITELKKQLTQLGFGNFSSNPSQSYDSATAQVVREFQQYYDRSATGNFSESDATFINSILQSHYVDGGAHANITELKLNLTKLGFGSFPSSPSNRYGPVTMGVVRDFQQHHGLVVNGIADTVTLQTLNSELAKLGDNVSQRQYQITLNQMVDRQMQLNPQTDLYGGGWQTARRADVQAALNPAAYSQDPASRDMFQFLILSQTSGVSSSQLNNILRNKGVLHATGNAFKTAAEKHGVNDLYLISHAQLETGNGESILSNGSIEVGQLSDNRWVSVQPLSNGNKAVYILERRYNSNGSVNWVRNRNDNFNLSNVNLRKTYNMFGIEAVDNDPYTRGSVRAYREGWFTPEASIDGGALFISSNYLGRGQDTLYKMRWDPDFHEAAVNTDMNIGRWQYQYATDIGWAYKQTRALKELYDQVEDPYLPFEVPSFR